MATALQLGMLQCAGGGSAQDAVIRVFPAWDAAVDAEFTLFARPCLKVSSTIRQGSIPYIRLTAQADREVRLRLPWEKAAVLQQGKQTAVQGDLIVLKLNKGETVEVKPA